MKKGTKLKQINEFWEENKFALTQAGYDEQIFKANMKQIMDTNKVKAPGAWKIFSRKREFKNRKEVGFENIVESIKALDPDKAIYKDFRKQVIGWNKKIDYNSVEFKNDKYYYTNYRGETYMLVLRTGSMGSQFWDWELMTV